jgi:glutamate dehydrogenase (NADP+)
MTYGGSPVRKEATGYGLVYLVEEMLGAHGHEIKGKTVTFLDRGTSPSTPTRRLRSWAARL